jgi:transcription antitermination protein NusB
MINRRHIRIKVMQSVYALQQSENQDLTTEEKFLLTNIYKLQDLYALMLELLVEIKKEASRIIAISKKKHLATESDLNPNKKFINNRVFLSIENSPTILAYLKERKLDLWKENSDFVKILSKEIFKSEVYIEYMESSKNSLEEDKAFIETIYTNIIASNNKLYDFIEDTNIGWIDDFPLVNTSLLKSVSQLHKDKYFKLAPLFRNEEDEKFVLDLFRKVVLNHHKFTKDIDAKTPNWDSERIAELDLILIKMALVEFVYFPLIPTKVTINEYLEIAKDYSTEKSSVFINGVLDKLLREYEKENKIKKVGRGLL